jgi:ribosomal protein S27E
MMRLSAEIVNGKCPTCNEYTILVGLTKELFKCLTCGTDLHQHVNGKISYLPAIQVPKGAKPFVREWKEEADGKNKV